MTNHLLNKLKGKDNPFFHYDDVNYTMISTKRSQLSGKIYQTIRTPLTCVNIKKKKKKKKKNCAGGNASEHIDMTKISNVESIYPKCFCLFVCLFVLFIIDMKTS